MAGCARASRAAWISSPVPLRCILPYPFFAGDIGSISDHRNIHPLPSAPLFRLLCPNASPLIGAHSLRTGRSVSFNLRRCQLAETLGGETRDSGPEMVGGSWEGGFREERSKCTALRSVCDGRGLCDFDKGSHYDNWYLGQKYFGGDSTVLHRLFCAFTK